MLYSRKMYLAGEVSHMQYYGQFVTSELIHVVTHHIGLQNILRSTDSSFNDIPLEELDALHGIMPLNTIALIVEANGGRVSLSDAVCAAKEAAKQIRGFFAQQEVTAQPEVTV